MLPTQKTKENKEPMQKNRSLPTVPVFPNTDRKASPAPPPPPQKRRAADRISHEVPSIDICKLEGALDDNYKNIIKIKKKGDIGFANETLVLSQGFIHLKVDRHDFYISICESNDLAEIWMGAQKIDGLYQTYQNNVNPHNRYLNKLPFSFELKTETGDLREFFKSLISNIDAHNVDVQESPAKDNVSGLKSSDIASKHSNLESGSKDYFNKRFFPPYSAVKKGEETKFTLMAVTPSPTVPQLMVNSFEEKKVSKAKRNKNLEKSLAQSSKPMTENKIQLVTTTTQDAENDNEIRKRLKF